LGRTAQNAVVALSPDMFAQHRGAGALFEEVTAEVI